MKYKFADVEIDLCTTEFLNVFEKNWIENTFSNSNYLLPTLENISKICDNEWDNLGCDVNVVDERIEKYYSGPQRILVGLFSEFDPGSIANRRIFTQWVSKQRPLRIADFGGGFGSLSRMIGKELPFAKIEIIEPYPHPLAVHLAELSGNVRYSPQLEGKYDIIISTDVFEHVHDPLILVNDTARYLKECGFYLIANCFYPIVKCHLPQTFHFRKSWNICLSRLGLIRREDVGYGSAYQKCGLSSLKKAREIEVLSIKSATLFEKFSAIPGISRVEKIIFNGLIW